MWRCNNTLAFWIATNVEVWNYDSPVGVGVSPNTGNIVPDVINYGWREYGLRVGLWRFADVFDAAGVKATVALNSLVCEHYPKAVDEMKKDRKKHTSELQSLRHLVCRLLLEKKKITNKQCK